MKIIDELAEKKAHLLRQMDVTMMQKLAFTSAHFQLAPGAKILDIGCAAGYGSYQFALLNPDLQVIAIDYDSDFILEAQDKYKLDNLKFFQADATKLDFGDEKFDATFNSSVLHEVYSFSGYSQKAVVDAIESQLSVLKDHGIILIRDFVRPVQPDKMVYLDVLDGVSAGQDYKDLSYPDLLNVYADLANSLRDINHRGFFMEEVDNQPGDGFKRFYLSHDWANEFLLRKEYRDRFALESREKYGYFTPDQFRSVPESLGARVVYTAPYVNPWIKKNWFDGKFRLFDENFKALPTPPSNFISVIQKINESEGAHLRENKIVKGPLQYLRKQSFQQDQSGRHYDLISRPGAVHDILPYYVHSNGTVEIYARADYPRPLVNAATRQMSPSLDGKSWAGYMVEPLAVVNEHQSPKQSVRDGLLNRAGIDRSLIASIENGHHYYTALSDVNEKVTAYTVRLNQKLPESPLKSGFSGFTQDGVLRPYGVQNLLKGIQVGMFPEARLELNAYALLNTLSISPGAWIEEQFEVPKSIVVMKMKPSSSGSFSSVDDTAGPAYLRGIRSSFLEQSGLYGGSKILGSRELEFAVPAAQEGKQISTNVAIAVPVTYCQYSRTIMIGLQQVETPALYLSEGEGSFETVRAHRLPSSVTTQDEAGAYLAGKYGLAESAVRPLGAGYFPSMGILPGRCFPYFLGVDKPESLENVRFMPLINLFWRASELKDANLMVAVYRLTHALGLWDTYVAAHKRSKKSALEAVI